ncbi:hypothetical protein [Streptomyces sp. NPDC093223]|uniref:hypothetical protein n=1 Tax=Streptomyces sp. NPDC093223 TaxID=3366033 RepID=UPI0037F1F7ED
MTDTIIMRHPTLPERQEIEVPRDARPHYTAAGWQLVPAEELKKRAEEAAKAKAAEAEAEQSADEAQAAESTPDEPAEPTTERPARSRTKATLKNEES